MIFMIVSKCKKETLISAKIRHQLMIFLQPVGKEKFSPKLARGLTRNYGKTQRAIYFLYIYINTTYFYTALLFSYNFSPGDYFLRIFMLCIINFLMCEKCAFIFLLFSQWDLFYDIGDSILFYLVYYNSKHIFLYCFYEIILTFTNLLCIFSQTLQKYR